MSHVSHVSRYFLHHQMTHTLPPSGHLNNFDHSNFEFKGPIYVTLEQLSLSLYLFFVLFFVME